MLMLILQPTPPHSVVLLPAYEFSRTGTGNLLLNPLLSCWFGHKPAIILTLHELLIN